MTPDWDHFRSFLAVLEEGTLSAAARRLGLTQPTLGRHIAEMEHRLGVILFTRSQAGLTPTIAATQLRPHAETMAAAADAFVRTASGEAQSETGAVRLTASNVIGIEVLPPILADFADRHPGIALELLVSDRNEDILRREADIAVRMAQPQQEALLARPVGDIELGFHAHPVYLERHGTPRTMEELRDHRIIGYDHETPIIRVLQQYGLTLGRENFGLRTDADLAHVAAIRAGFGIGICQVPIGRRDGLVRLLKEDFAFPLPCFLVMHEDLRGIRRMRLAFDAIADGLAAYNSGRI